MDMNVFKDRLGIAHNQQRYLWLLIGVLSAAVLLLSLCFALQKTTVRTLVLPQHVSQPFWIDDEHVSESYLSDMAEYVLNEYLTVTSYNITHRFENLLKLSAPEAASALEDNLNSYSRKVKHERLSTTFYPQSVDADVAHLSATVKGRYTGRTEQHVLFNKLATFEVKFRLNQGRIWLLSIKEQTNKKEGK